MDDTPETLGEALTRIKAEGSYLARMTLLLREEIADIIAPRFEAALSQAIDAGADNVVPWTPQTYRFDRVDWDSRRNHPAAARARMFLDALNAEAEFEFGLWVDWRGNLRTVLEQSPFLLDLFEALGAETPDEAAIPRVDDPVDEAVRILRAWKAEADKFADLQEDARDTAHRLLGVAQGIPGPIGAALERAVREALERDEAGRADADALGAALRCALVFLDGGAQ